MKAWKSQRLSPFELDVLESSLFDCHACGAKVKYDDGISHATHKCAALTLTCPAECGERAFDNEEILRVHLKDKCKRIVHACAGCNIQNPRFIILQSEHPCTKQL